MVVYVLLTCLIGLVLGIVLAVRTKKAPEVVYGRLDNAGQITNIILIPVYLILSPLYAFIGIISEPIIEGFITVFAFIASGISGAAGLICALGLGLSVSLRKKGHSKASFIIQFAGFVGIALTLLLYVIFVDVLFLPIN